jgi:predicted site-specific integrase-resolvase
MSKLYGATEAAKMAGVSRATICRAVADGRLKPSLDENGKRRFTLKDIESYVMLRRAWYSTVA